MKKAKKAKHKGLVFRIICSVFAVLVFGAFICGLVGVIGAGANNKLIDTFQKVQSEDPLPAPVWDEENKSYSFTCDREFKIMQLTDLHIGAGFISINRDNMALNTIYGLVDKVKPDLIIVTGDLSFPVPFMSGSFNQMPAMKMVAKLMENMGVYWTFGFGNHDSEVYSFYSREEVSDFFEDPKFEHCLYTRGPDDVDGLGNQVINIKNSAGIITQSLYILDSHSYKKGFLRDYDNLHENQVAWYEGEVKKWNEINAASGAVDPIKSLMFFHIPLVEYRDAYNEYANNDKHDTDNVKYHYGVMGETEGICCGTGEDDMFEKILELRSTQGIFVGHDHYSNFSFDYNGGKPPKEGEEEYFVRLTYGFSIDYLAYMFAGILKRTNQRGCTVINVATDGSFDCYGLRYSDGKVIHDPEDYGDAL